MLNRQRRVIQHAAAAMYLFYCIVVAKSSRRNVAFHGWGLQVHPCTQLAGSVPLNLRGYLCASFNTHCEKPSSLST